MLGNPPNGKSAAKTAYVYEPSHVDQEWKDRVLSAFTKLADKDTNQLARNTLTAVIEELDDRTFQPFMSMLLEVCETGSPTQANDSLKLFAICTSLYKRAVVPFMGRALKAIVKRIKDTTNQQVRAMRQTCNDVLEVVVRFVPRTSSSLKRFFAPFFELLKDADKGTQACAGLCIAGIIQNGSKELVVELAESLCTHILSSLQTALPKCATSLLTALARLVEATEDTLAPQLADIVGTVLPFLRVAPTSDYMTRKTAAETLNVLCTHVGDAVLPFRATIVERLEDAKCDRIKQVRDAAASAQCEYYALGSTAAAPLGAPPRHAPPAVPRVRDDSPETPPDDQPSVSASHKRRRAPHDVPVTICVPPKKERAEPCAAEKENAGYVPHTPSRVLADITHVVGTATAQDHAVQDRAVQPSGTSPEQEEVGCCGLGRHTDAHETDGVCAADALQPEQAQARLQSQLHDLKQQCAEKERLLQVLKATSPHKTPSHTPHKTAHTTPCRTPVAAHKEDVPKGDGLAPIRQYDSSLTFPVGERIDAVERRIGALEQGTDTTVMELHKLRENVAALAAAVAAMHETCEKLAARQGAPSASVPAPSASSVSAPVFRTPARAAPPHTLETPYFARGGAGSLDWREVRQRCVTGDYGFAFGRVLAGEPADIDQTLSYLMRKTGAVADRLPEDTTAEVFRCVARWLAERHAVDVCLQWAEQETERTSHRFASAALVQDVCDGLDAIGTENGADGTRARGIAKKLRKKYQTALC